MKICIIFPTEKEKSIEILAKCLKTIDAEIVSLAFDKKFHDNEINIEDQINILEKYLIVDK